MLMQVHKVKPPSRQDSSLIDAAVANLFCLCKQHLVDIGAITNRKAEHQTRAEAVQSHTMCISRCMAFRRSARTEAFEEILQLECLDLGGKSGTTTLGPLSRKVGSTIGQICR